MENNDTKQGMIKTTWEKIRHKVQRVEPNFSSLVDDINPGNDYPLYLAYYPYGAVKGDTCSTFFPSEKGGFYRISDSDAPKDVVECLGYSSNFAPFTLLLEKNLELFVDLPHQGITIPRIIYTPGSFFPFSRILKNNNTRTYAPNNMLTMTSGARSTFMLPNIGCSTHHANLQRSFNTQLSAPKTLYEHWFVFKELLGSNKIQCDWRSCLLYFSEKWLNSITNDKHWMPVRLYLHELAWRQYEYQHNLFYYDLTISLIQKKKNLKPNPYLADTSKHLIAMALGAAPGYTPATDDSALPNNVLQDVFINHYGMKKYFPTILQPKHFCFENDTKPIYYSLQHPTTHMFSPKSRSAASTISELRELERITRIFTLELSKAESMCSDTIIGKISNEMKFNYYHNKDDLHNVIKKSDEIPNHDPRFIPTNKLPAQPDATFACDATFLRGCISIQSNQIVKNNHTKLRHGIPCRDEI